MKPNQRTHYFLYLAVAVLVLFALSGCTAEHETKDVPIDKYGMPEGFDYGDGESSTKVPDDSADTKPAAIIEHRDFSIHADANQLYKAVIPLGKVYSDSALYAGVLYFASKDGVIALDLADKTERVFAEGAYACVDADQNGVYVLTSNSFTKFDVDGNAVLSYPISSGTPVCGTVMGEKYLFAANAGNGTAHEIFSLSLADGTVENVSGYFVDPNANSTRLYVTDMQSVGSTVWTVSVDQNEQNVLIQTDFRKKKVEAVEKIVLGIDSIDVVGDQIYYLKSRVTRSYIDIYSANLDKWAESVVTRVVTAQAETTSAENDGMMMPALRFDKIFFTGKDYILWSAMKKTVFVVADSDTHFVTVLGPAETMYPTTAIPWAITSFPRRSTNGFSLC